MNRMTSTVLLFLLTFSLVLSACQTESVQTAVAPEKPTPTPPLDFLSVLYGGVSLQFDSALAKGVIPQRNEAYSDNTENIFNILPEHIRLDFDAPYSAQEPFEDMEIIWEPWVGSPQNPEKAKLQPQIFIFPVDSFAQISPQAAERIQILSDLLKTGTPPPDQELPVLPMFSGSQDLRAQVRLLEFKNGNGVRFVTRYSQGIDPIVNPMVFYTYQGLSQDRNIYIAAFFPLYISTLPDEYQVEDWAQFCKNYNAYLLDTTAQLEQLEPEQYIPNLGLIDGLIQTISALPTDLLDAQRNSVKANMAASEQNTQKIAVEDAQELKAIQVLGKGSITGEPLYSADGRMLAIPTSLGIDLYDELTPDPIRHLTTYPNVPREMLSFSADGKLLAGAARENSFAKNGRLLDAGQEVALVWDTQNGSLVARIPAVYEDPLADIMLAPDGKHIALGSHNGAVQVWTLPGQEKVLETSGVRVEFSPDSSLLVTMPLKFSGDGKIRLYNMENKKLLGTWEGQGAAFMPSGQLLIEQDGAIRVINLQDNKAVFAFSGLHPAVSDDESQLAVFSMGRVRLYSLLDGNLITTLTGSYEDAERLYFSPDGTTVAGDMRKCSTPNCAFPEYIIQVWSVANGELLYSQSGLQMPSWMRYSVDGKLLLLVFQERIDFISPLDSSLAKQIEGYSWPVDGMGFSSRGDFLATVGSGNGITLRLWLPESGSLLRELTDLQDFNDYNRLPVALTPEGRYANVHGTIWDAVTGERIPDLERQLAGTTEPVYQPLSVFSPDGSMIATNNALDSDQIVLLSYPDIAQLNNLAGAKGEMSSLSFSMDGSLLAASFGHPAYEVRVWQLPQGNSILSLKGEEWTHVYTQAVLSPDGQLLATVAENYDGLDLSVAQVWKVSDGSEVYQLPVYGIKRVAFSPDGALLASGSFDRIVRVWDGENGELLALLQGHIQEPSEVLFSPEGDILASASQDGTVILWGK